MKERKAADGMFTRSRSFFGANCFRSKAALVLLSFSMLGIPLAYGQPSGLLTVQGHVFDLRHHPQAGATVRLQMEGSSSSFETRTNESGAFQFSGVTAGSYQLRADKSGMSSNAVEVPSSSGDSQSVELVLGCARSGEGESEGMEFTDKPNFTVAGITDWTAVGGHGSDSILRTSETLAKATLVLKAGTETAGSIDKSNRSQSESSLSQGQAMELSQIRATMARGDLAAARLNLKTTMATHPSAELYGLAGELDEKLGDPLAAVRELEQAVRLDPSEQNYFAWGSELLVHRAVWQAQEVFERGLQAHPGSALIETGLGTALFGEARYEEAATRLCAASDLDPANPEPYLFMGRIGMVAPASSPCLEEKLARFVREQPANSQASYLYAMTILKRQERAPDLEALSRAEKLLMNAVKDDAKCADGYLQLGILQSSRRNFDKAIEFYSEAIAANPQLADAHYRLGVAYDRVGKRDKADIEFRLHDDLVKQQSDAVEAERREVKQFLVVLDGQPASPSAH